MIDYLKFESTNEQLLDKTHKDKITLLWQNKLEKIYYNIINDIFEENPSF